MFGRPLADKEGPDPSTTGPTRMEFITWLYEFIFQVDQHLADLITQLGVWFYVLMFVIVFCETGLVVTPFLPGDSLLFALGAMAARDDGPVLWILFVSLWVASIIGDSTNYWIGSKLGPRIFKGENVRFLNRKHLERTEYFFAKYGGKTIALSRFMPIVRTFAPFVAGMGRMHYPRFMFFNVVGGLAWSGSFLLLGYYFGNIPVVKENFTLVIIGIIILSILPGVIEIIRARRAARREKAAANGA